MKNHQPRQLGQVASFVHIKVSEALPSNVYTCVSFWCMTDTFLQLIFLCSFHIPPPIRNGTYYLYMLMYLYLMIVH
jgi:hypothetical protein